AIARHCQADHLVCWDGAARGARPHPSAGWTMHHARSVAFGRQHRCILSVRVDGPRLSGRGRRRIPAAFPVKAWGVPGFWPSVSGYLTGHLVKIHRNVSGNLTGWRGIFTMLRPATPTL